MISTLLVAIYIGSCNGLRGPHHPRGTSSHHHYSPQKNKKLTQEEELLQDATHLKEDIGSMAEHLDFSNMTEEEIAFHYFDVHDVDNNEKLDGLEILNAIQHTFHDIELYDPEYGNSAERMKPLTYEDAFPRIIKLVDKTLKEDDLDNDGYLGYTEYVLGRQKAYLTQAKKNLENTDKEQSAGE